MASEEHVPTATKEARARLLAECDALRENQHLFSFETLRGWHELQRNLESSLDDIARGVADAGEQAVDIAVSRLEELTRAVHSLRENNEEVHARQLMSVQPASSRPEDTLNLAAQMMWELDCGVLPVVDHDGRLVGIVTDRDICMGAYIQGKSLHDSLVASVMSTQVHTCTVDDTLADVAAKLRDHRIRRLPVLDAANHLVGMISVMDIARHLATLPVAHPLRALLVPTLAGIGTPRTCT